MTQDQGSTAAGWYADPSGEGEYRWWDGSNWTDQTRSLDVVEPDAVTGFDTPQPFQVSQEVLTTPAVGAGPEQPLVQIGDMYCTQHTLVTPNGTMQLRGVQFLVRENVAVTQKIPTYAIVLAILFALLCLIGLLMLLIKETEVTGVVEVTATGPEGYYVTSIRVSDQNQLDHIRSSVAYARQLAAQLA